MKKFQNIFFVLTIITLLFAVTAVSAADNTDNNIVINDAQTTVDTDSGVLTQEQATASCDNLMTNTKNKITKDDKQIKTATKTVQVNNMNELSNAINSAVNDADNDEYIINLNEGTYQITGNTIYNTGSYSRNIIINANNQTLSGNSASRYLRFTNFCNITLNDAITTLRIQNYCNLTLNNVNIKNMITNYADANLTLNNVTSNATLSNNGNLFISDDVIFVSPARISGSGAIFINNANIIYPYVSVFSGKSTLSNITLDKVITNNGELTLNNVTVDNKVINNGKLIISDDCTITDNFGLRGDGDVITNFTLSDNVYNTTKIIEVSTSSELSTAVNNAINDAFYTPYIINLNEGEYSFPSATRTGTKPEIIINGNNQSLNGNSDASLINACNNTINQANVNSPIRVGGTGTFSSTPLTTLTLNQVTVSKNIVILANGALTLNNSTVLGNIDNKGKLIISEDTVFDSNANLTSSGTLITNNTNILYPYQDSFNGGTLKDITIDKNITTIGNFTLKNVTVDSSITNNGRLIIDDDVIFTENGLITGSGEIIINDITRILPYLQTLNGNYTITDVTLNKSYNYMGNVTLDNCNITSTGNINYGILNIKNSNITVDDESTWISNYGLLIIENTNTLGNIKNNGELYIDNLPEDYTYANTYHVVNNDTAPLYFNTSDGNTLSDLVKEGDTLDFQGTIASIPGLSSLVINKPINLITSTNDGRIENFGGITYINGASGSNVSGLYTYNTQFHVRNAHDIVFNNISNVVISKGVGGGVGQTSIRDNSTRILINNSFIYTKDNGGSSSFVITYSSNCTIENSIIQGAGNVGNILYLNTYNPTITTPEGNCYNTLRNNTVIGPDSATGICWAIVIDGHDNLVENNKIYYKGTGITTAYGGSAPNNIYIGNEFHNGSGFNGIANSTVINNTAYDNGLITIAANSMAINNTANKMTVSGANCIVGGNNITTLTVSGADAVVENNTATSISVTGANPIVNNNTIESGTINANNVLSFENNTITTSITTSKSMNITNNKINDISIRGSDSNLKNNNIIGLLTADASINITENNLNNVNINVAGTNLTNNNITGTVTSNADNVLIEANNINTSNENTVIINANNNTVKDNILHALNTAGVFSIITRDDTILENNLPKYELNIDTTEFTIGQTSTITASIYFDGEIVNTINAGKVVFKVNGKTLKDDKGKVIYAKVVNGTAKIENYMVPESWNKDNMTIEAVYSGSSQCNSLRSEKTEITISKEPTFTTEDVTATIGETITLKATLTDGNKVINNGKVVFKINGKTVKDANGKTIYAKIKNGIATVNYTIPENYKAKEYTLSATLISNEYDRLEDSKTLTVS